MHRGGPKGHGDLVLKEKKNTLQDQRIRGDYSVKPLTSFNRPNRLNRLNLKR